MIAARHQKICEQCGKAFTADRSNALTCSSRCRQAKYRFDNRPVQVCPNCNEPFEGRYNMKYCSKACKQSAYRRRPKQGS